MKNLIASLLLACSLCSQAKPEKESFEPTAQFKDVEIEGFTIKVNKRLFHERKEVGDQALRQLTAQLYFVTRVVPEKPLAELRKVPIWLDDRKTGPAQYHPDQGWLIRNNYNPDKTKSVDIGRPEDILHEFYRQPYVMLHELAHAYHHRVLSFEEPRIIAAYEAAKKSGKYQKVLNYWDREEKAYALSNHKEYFAECTEAFLGQNDFYPFVRAELKQYDPVVYKLLGEIWGR